MPQTLTRIIFDVETLTEIYMEQMAPLVYSKTAHRNLPVMYVYKDVLEGLDKLADKNDEGKKLKKDILGSSTIEMAPSDYFDMALAIDLKMADSWDDLDVHVKARIRAQRFLSNMVDVIERYREEMEKIAKKAAGNHG